MKYDTGTGTTKRTLSTKRTYLLKSGQRKLIWALTEIITMVEQT